MSIDASSVSYEIAKGNFAGTRWEVNLSGIRVEAPTPSTALGVVAQALCRPYPAAPDPETEVIHVEIDREAWTRGTQAAPGRQADLVRSPEELRKQLEVMAAARMSPEWIAGAMWAASWMRGEVD